MDKSKSVPAFVAALFAVAVAGTAYIVVAIALSYDEEMREVTPLVGRAWVDTHPPDGWQGDYTQSRIVLRSDGRYEVERYFGRTEGWCNMGGIHATLEEAQELIRKMELNDEEAKAEAAITRTVIERSN